MFVYPHSGLIKDYDGIVENDAESRTLKKADPLKTLPTELWLHILTDIVGSDSTKLLPLLLVSQHWCNVLLAASSLWTNIYIRDLPPDDDGDLSADLLPLSKDLPISVTVEIPSVALDKTHRIWKEMKRIRDLAFKRSPERIRTQSPVDVLAMERFYDTVFHHLSSFDILPIETLTMDHAFDYYSLSMVERRFPIAPNLKAIHFWCMTTESFSNLPTKNLTFLSASSPLEALYACLPPVKQLKRLVLTQAGDAAHQTGRPSTPRSGRILSKFPIIYASSPERAGVAPQRSTYQARMERITDTSASVFQHPTARPPPPDLQDTNKRVSEL
ncbi:hypothetical protein FRC18_001358 [Serendipita sp. 400]|nr:hypothetical protein FRC18_001358 [Serendipita sp. 400]